MLDLNLNYGQVSAEAPSFKTVIHEKTMIVVGKSNFKCIDDKLHNSHTVLSVPS